VFLAQTLGVHMSTAELTSSRSGTGNLIVDHKTQKSEQEKLEARAIRRILDRKSGVVVGWIYLWNNGQEEPMWICERRDGVTYD